MGTPLVILCRASNSGGSFTYGTNWPQAGSNSKALPDQSVH